MNILLTDLSSLPLDLPERPATTAGGDAGFTRLFREQLSPATADEPQAFDLKYFFSEVEVAPASPPKAEQALSAEFLADFPRQQQGLAAVVATSPAPPVEVARQLPLEALSLQIEPAASLAAKGPSLPHGGNPLPADGAGPALGEPPVPPLALPAEAADGPQIAVLAAGSTLPTGTANIPVADVPGRSAGESTAMPAMPPSRSPASLWSSAMVSPRDSVQPNPVPATAESAQMAGADTGLGDTLAKAPRAAQAQTPQPADGQLSSTVSRTLADASASASAAPASRSGAEMAAPQAQQGNGESKRPGTAAIEIPPVPRGAVAVDNARQPDSRAAAEFFTAASRVTPDTAATAGEIGPRSAEMPPPANGNGVQAQAAVTAQAPLPQPATGQNSAVQAALPTQLSAPLDIPGLARGGDAAEWGNAVGERVSWMINQKQNSASIRLDPPALGKLDVQVRVSDDATTITIQTQHAQTRDLIDAASLRLRDYLQENGFQNVNVDVSQRQDQQQARAQSASPESGGEEADSAPEQDSAARQQQAADYFIGEGLLDTFA